MQPCRSTQEPWKSNRCIACQTNLSHFIHVPTPASFLIGTTMPKNERQNQIRPSHVQQLRSIASIVAQGDGQSEAHSTCTLN
jgi:hypothetical protein